MSIRDRWPLLTFIFVSLASGNAAAWGVPAAVQPPSPAEVPPSAPAEVPPPAPADAAPPAPAPAPPPAAAEPPESGVNLETGNEVQPSDNGEVEKKGKKKKKKDKEAREGGGPGVLEGGSNVRSNYGIGEIKLGGYIFARGDLQQMNRTALSGGSMPATYPLDLSVPSIRFRLDYLSPWPWLSGQIEMDFAGKPDLRDGYVQAKGEHVSFRMGQFKMPVLAMQMESPWSLPLVRRGLIHDLTVDWLDVAGRLPGAMVTLRGRFGDVKPRLFLGAFQGRRFVEIDADGSRDTDIIRERNWGSQKLVARGQVDIGSVEIGLVYEHRLGSPTALQVRRFWTAGGDLTVNHVFATGGLRIWIDGLAGASWYELVPVAGQDATFITARALVAYRFGGVVPEAPYIEPYLFGGVMDPDTDVTSDLAWEATAGVNVGFYGRARVTLQAEVDRIQRNFPPGFLGLDPDLIGQISPNRLALIAQVGLAY